jgi:hypothetical protein
VQDVSEGVRKRLREEGWQWDVLGSCSPGDRPVLKQQAVQDRPVLKQQAMPVPAEIVPVYTMAAHSSKVVVKARGGVQGGNRDYCTWGYRW